MGCGENRGRGGSGLLVLIPLIAFFGAGVVLGTCLKHHQGHDGHCNGHCNGHCRPGPDKAPGPHEGPGPDKAPGHHEGPGPHEGPSSDSGPGR